MKPILREGIIINTAVLRASDLIHKHVLCPACGTFIFQMWPEGWDGHAGHKCPWLEGTTVEERKAEFKEKFAALFR